MRTRCENPLESAWRRQLNTVSKSIINSRNDMKTQTSKYHTFSVLLFYQLSLYIQFSREFFHSTYNYATISRSLRILLYAATHGTKFPKSMLQKIYFSKRMTAPQLSRAVNLCKLQRLSYYGIFSDLFLRRYF